MVRLSTRVAVRTVLKERNLSKYALAKQLNLSAPIQIDNYLTGTRMGIVRAELFKELFSIEITDPYDPRVEVK